MRIVLATAAAPSRRFPAASSVVTCRANYGGTVAFSLRKTYTNFLCTLRANSGCVHSKHCGGIIIITNSGVATVASCRSHSAYPLFNSTYNTILLRPAARRINIVSAVLHASNMNCSRLVVGSNNSTCPPSRSAISGHRRFIFRSNGCIFGCTISCVTSITTRVTRQGKLARSSVT